MSVGTRKSRFASAVGTELGLIVGFITVVTFFSAGTTWMANLENLPWLVIMFIWLFGVMAWCAFGVMRHAEALAERFGEPYGTLILTISVIGIEVTIMATVMLSGNPNPTLPHATSCSVRST